MAKETQQHLSKDLFEPLELSTDKGEEITREQLTYWQDAWIRLRKNKGAILGIVILAFLLVMSLIGPHLNHYGFDDQKLSRHSMPPRVQGLENISWLGMDGKETMTFEGATVDDATRRGTMVMDAKNDSATVKVLNEGNAEQGIPAKIEMTNDIYKAKGESDSYFWFGTDQLGRDLWTRTWQGTRISLYIAFLAAFIDMVIGVAYGGISAYYGGRVDNYMQRVVEILVGIPNLVVVILMILILKPGILSITIAITITGWIGMSRMVRGQILKLKNQEFVLAAQTLGASNKRILTKHLIPNVTGIIVINTMFTIPGAIFFEAFLSFIGLGLQPPVASLGTLISDAFKSFQVYPFMLLYPALVISLIMIAFNIVADGLRDALDPKMRE